ncbi:hypothetical protein DL96DRAFT_1634737, partial [Flagelloscypha sp. PMI_526]
MSNPLTESERELKNKVRRMQRRVQQMEAERNKSLPDEPECPVGSILLHPPYAVASSSLAVSADGVSDLPAKWFEAFYINRSSFAFFLDPETFLKCCSGPEPAVIPRLRWLSYLCGGLVLGSFDKVDTFMRSFKELDRTTCGALMPKASVREQIEYLQTGLLWVKLHLYSNKILDANYSSTKAIATTSPLKLGCLGSQNTNSTVDKLLSREDGEKIHACWNLIDSEAVLAIAKNGLINLNEDGGKPSIHVDTPFPRPLSEYNSIRVHHIPPENTIKAVQMSPTPISPKECLPSLQIKAIMFFYWCHIHSAAVEKNGCSDIPEHMVKAFHFRDAQLVSFIQTMPPLGQGHDLYPSIRYQTNIHAARITLHRQFVGEYVPSRQPAFQSAFEIFRLATLLPSAIKFIDASFALAWEKAGLVLAGLDVAEWESQSTEVVRQGLSRMAAYRRSNAFMEERIGKVVQALGTTFALRA